MTAPPSPYKRLWPLAVIFGLLLIALLVRRALWQPGQSVVRDTGERLSAPPFRLDDVARLELYRAKSETPSENAKDSDVPATLPRVELVRAEGGWRIASYHQAPARERLLKSYLQMLRDLTGEARSAGPDELAAFGLGENQAVHIKASAADGRELIHLLAGKRPVSIKAGAAGFGRNVFVRRAGEARVFEVQVDLRELPANLVLAADSRSVLLWKSWFDPVITAIPRDDVKRIVLKWPERELTLADASWGQDKAVRDWEVERGGMGLNLRPEAPNLLLAALENFQADDVLAMDDPARVFLGELSKKEQYHSEITRDSGPAVIIRGAEGMKPDERIVVVSTRPGVVYHLDAWSFARLFRRAADLFWLPRPRLGKGDPERIVTHGKSSGERTYKKNAAGEWRLVAPAFKHPTLAAGAEDVARALFALRFADAVEPARVKTAPQRRKRGLGLNGEKRFGAVTCHYPDGSQRSLILGTPARGSPGRYATMGDPKMPALVVADYDVKRIFPLLAKLVDPRLLPEATALTITAVTVAGAEAKNDFALEKAAGLWTVTLREKNENESAHYEGRQLTIEEWLATLAALTADSLDVLAPSEENKRERPSFEITVRIEQGAPIKLAVYMPIKGDHTIVRSDRKLLAFRFEQHRTGELQPKVRTFMLQKIEPREAATDEP